MSRRRSRTAPVPLSSTGAEIAEQPNDNLGFTVEDVALEIYVRQVCGSTSRTPEHIAQESFRLARIFCEASERLTLEEPRNGTV